MTKKLISDEDRTLFQEAAEGTRPLHHDRIYPYRTPVQSRSKRSVRESDDEKTDNLFSDSIEADDLTAVEDLEFFRSGLQQRLIRRLRRGQMPIEAELDLHGLTVAEARQVLSQFLYDMHRAEVRSMRIIHGRGFGSKQQIPVLKRKVAYWLQQRSDVLAFCSAIPRHGGSGAIYLLIGKKAV